MGSSGEAATSGGATAMRGARAPGFRWSPVRSGLAWPVDEGDRLGRSLGGRRRGERGIAGGRISLAARQLRQDQRPGRAAIGPGQVQAYRFRNPAPCRPPVGLDRRRKRGDRLRLRAGRWPIMPRQRATARITDDHGGMDHQDSRQDPLVSDPLAAGRVAERGAADERVEPDGLGLGLADRDCAVQATVVQQANAGQR